MARTTSSPSSRSAAAAIDERYDPEASIEGAANYLGIAGDRFGDEQLAVVSYHMGIGNLETIITDYTGEPVGEGTTAKLVDDEGLSYAQLFFDTPPQPRRRPGSCSRASATTPPPTSGGYSPPSRR